jgi:hypothetical protein
MLFTPEPLPVHPAAALLPEMSDDEYQRLKADIAAHGLLDPIVTLDGQLLDGRHRERACLENHICPRSVEYTGTNPVGYVLSKNLHRRHLTESQRAMVASKLTTLRDGQTAAKVGKFAQLPPVTNKQAADMLKVSERTVKHARAVRDRGTPEVVKAVEKGDVKVSVAAKVARLPKEQQAEAIGQKKAKKKAQPKSLILENFNGPASRAKDQFGKLFDKLSPEWVDEYDREEMRRYLRFLADSIAAPGPAAEVVPNDKPEELPKEADREPSPVADPPHEQQPVRPPIQAGEVTIKKLKSLYGDHAEAVLGGDYLEYVPREKKGAIRTYKVQRPLPTAEEFEELQRRQFTSTVAEAVGGAFMEIQELAMELSNWYENLPDSFKWGDKGEAIQEAANTLEGLEHPDVPEQVGAIKVYNPPVLNRSSRAARRDAAVSNLQTVIGALGEARAKCQGGDDKLLSDEINTLVSELETAVEEAEGVEFPGMYS